MIMIWSAHSLFQLKENGSHMIMIMIMIHDYDYDYDYDLERSFSFLVQGGPHAALEPRSLILLQERGAT